MIFKDNDISWLTVLATAFVVGGATAAAGGTVTHNWYVIALSAIWVLCGAVCAALGWRE